MDVRTFGLSTRLHIPASIVLLAALLVGPAVAQTSLNMDLLGNLDEYTEYSDVWGYTDEFGNEYAILGTIVGTSIINVTNPATAYETGFIPGSNSFWRDMKTYGDYAYIVTEGTDGLQIVDLTDPESPNHVATYNGFTSAHNIYIEEATARAYACGANVGGTQILDLSNPTSPTLIGNYTTRYVHDLYVRNNIAYMAEINDASLSVVDVSNAASPQLIGGPITYLGAFTHNTWLTDDGSHVATSDELTGAVMRLWDVSSVPIISLAGTNPSPNPSAIMHNILIDGDRAFISHYTEGVRVVDVSSPTTPAEFAYYDTYPGASGGFNGAWGVYPFLPSGNILVSDINTGLYVLELTGDLGRVVGVVNESGLGTPLQGAQVELLGSSSVSTNAAGEYSFNVVSGSYTLEVSLEGFFTHSEPVMVTGGVDLVVDVDLVRLPSASLQGQVRGRVAGVSADLAEVELSLAGTGYTATSDAGGNYSFPLVPLGSYTLRYDRAGFASGTVPASVTEAGDYLNVTLYAAQWYDDADQDLGWSLFDLDDTATTGQWIRAIPVPSQGGQVQTGVDATPGADLGLCFVTGNAGSPESGIGTADIDGGKTTLTTPLLDLSGISDPYMSYARWYTNSAGANPGQDIFRVQISDDAGANWEPVETLSSDATPWTRVEFRVLDFVNPTNQVLLRFIAADDAPGSAVEAAVDDVEVYGLSGTGGTPGIPARFTATLHANVPNPFNPVTEFRFSTSVEGQVRLDVHDQRGRRVARVVDAYYPAGDHSLRWEARDSRGRGLASGVYLASLALQGSQSIRKITLAK